MNNKLLTDNVYKIDIITRLNLLEYLALDIQKEETLNMEQLIIMKVYFANTAPKRRDVERSISAPSGLLSTIIGSDANLIADERGYVKLTEKGLKEAERIKAFLNADNFKDNSSNFQSLKKYLFYFRDIDKDFEPEEAVLEFIISLRVLMKKLFVDLRAGLPSISALYYIYIFEEMTHARLIKYVPQRTSVQMQAIVKSNYNLGNIKYLTKEANKRFTLTEKGVKLIEEAIINANMALDRFAALSPTKTRECVNAIIQLNDLAGELITKAAIQENLNRIQKKY